jgi:hypothetical protein
MIPLTGEEPPAAGGRRPTVPRPLRLAVALAIVISLLSGCDLDPGGPGGSTLTFGNVPAPTCGGIKVLIEGALPCDVIAARALDELATRAPEQLARGVTAIDVMLADCPAGEVPQLIDCTGVQFAQLVTVTFEAPRPGGPIEPSLTVALEPVTGRLLGIANPLIR